MSNIKISGIVVVVAVLVVGGLLSAHVWNPSWNPFQGGEKNIVEDSIIKLFESKSFKTKTDLTADISVITSQGEQKGKIILDIDADFDLRDKNKIKNAADIDITVSAEGMEFSAGLQTIATAKGLYFKLKSIPAFLPLPVDLSSIKGQWFGIEKNLLESMFTSKDTDKTDEEKTKEFMAELKNILSDKNIFSIEKSFGEEKIGGVSSKHYLVAVRKEAVKQIVPELFKLIKKYIPEEEMTGYEQDTEKALAEFPQKVDSVWQKTGGIKFEIWVGRGVLRKIKWKNIVDLKDAQSYTDEITGGNVSISVEAIFSDINKNIDIKEPADYKPFESILNLLGGAPMGGFVAADGSSQKSSK